MDRHVNYWMRFAGLRPAITTTVLPASILLCGENGPVFWVKAATGTATEPLGHRLFAHSFFALVWIEPAFSEPDGFGGNFDQFVALDV